MTSRYPVTLMGKAEDSPEGKPMTLSVATDITFLIDPFCSETKQMQQKCERLLITLLDITIENTLHRQLLVY